MWHVNRRFSKRIGICRKKKDFIHKLTISLKEANETEYWLNLLKDCEIIDIKTFDSINSDITEILKLLISIIKKSKSNTTNQL